MAEGRFDAVVGTHLVWTDAMTGVRMRCSDQVLYSFDPSTGTLGILDCRDS